ncbi:protease modulator HflC [Parvibium lacunae]|uniref:Protein HflC n=1 Tax=Parvibium lacunae TaxID=1888893 RepID=A0A368L8R3_9BURK|nr:protease modulator HflC [Parvibium lacunae]RCS59952.1 protease modulator HflC [Parvibium lacunae]
MNRIMPALVIVGLVLLFGSSCIYVVNQRQYAIVFGLGEIKEVVKEPGLFWKLPPPFQNVVYLEKRILTIDTPDADRFITAEKKNLLVDSFVKWRIADPKQYYISVSGDDRRAQDRLSQIIKSALNEEITKRSARDVVSGERTKVMEIIAKKIGDDAKQIGIDIVDVRLKRVDLLPEVSESVYKRMEAERKRVANELRSTGAAESEKIRADADRQREVILAEAYRDAQKLKGEGDAKASATYAQAFGANPEFYAFYRSLEAYRASFKSKQDVLVVDPSSEFFKFMKQAGKTGK